MKVTKKNTEKINKCQSIYIVVLYAKWGVREYKWTGKWKYSKLFNSYEPIVYDYDDHNGTFEEYVKRPIHFVTTGWIIDWTFSKYAADRFAKLLNEEMEKPIQFTGEFKDNKFLEELLKSELPPTKVGGFH